MRTVVKCNLSVFFFLAALLISVDAGADDLVPGGDLSGYEPSYFVIAFDDDDHLEFKLSVKYPLIKSTGKRFDEITGGSNDLYFGYTGKYDFFLFSDDPARESAPVISRLQNPGLFIINRRASYDGEGLESITVGWFHESNGQQISDNATFAATANAEDFVSRGWDYLAVDARYSQHEPLFFDGDVIYQLKLRFFCDCQGLGFIDDKEDDITIFGGSEQATIREYDGVRFIIDNYANEHLHYGLTVQTGISDLLENNSVQFQITYRILNVPVKVFYFKGYGKDISTYHIRDEYAGIGFEFW